LHVFIRSATTQIWCGGKHCTVLFTPLSSGDRIM